MSSFLILKTGKIEYDEDNLNISSNEYMSEEEIVYDLIDRLDIETKLKLLSTEKEKLCIWHHSLGRWIRNVYGLWHQENKINKGPTVIKSGIDFSPNHPDAISTRIIKQLVLVLEGNKQ